MKIGIDLTFIKADHKNGGTESVIKNLMKGISAMNAEGTLDDDIIFFIHESLYKEYKKMFPDLKFKPYRMPGKHAIRMILFQTLYLPKLAKKEQLDVLYFPTFQTGLGKFDMPVVVSPHDIQFKYYPEYFSTGKRIYYQIFYKRALKRAKKLIIISDYAKSSYEKYFNKVTKNKMKVLYDPIDLSLLEKKPGRKKKSDVVPDGEYILCINSLTKHKNIITLLKAYKRLLDEKSDKDIKLVLVGAKWNDANELSEYVKENDLTNNVIMTGVLDDESVADLYKNARLFVTPSLYEGFGMTPVEAMAAECPVISSRETSLPEATMGMVTYYDNATDDKALCEAIKKELEIDITDKVYKAELKKRSKTVKEKYEINKITADYLDVIRAAGKAANLNIKTDKNGEEETYKRLYDYVNGVMKDNGKSISVKEDEFLERISKSPLEDDGSVVEKVIAFSGIRDFMALRKLAKKLPKGVQDVLRRFFV